MKARDRQRLDVELVQRALAETRSQAQALILAGQVTVNGKVETKAGHGVFNGDRIEVMQPARYVSRGGLKLEHALTVFGIVPRDWEVVDVGASTGGFTDCWLQFGARRVYAVDVGYGQLHWTLRHDARVVVRERCNARALALEQLDRTELLDAASIDVSFIGLRLILPPVARIVHPTGTVIALIKPQFEAGPRDLDAGVVRDPAVHRRVVSTVLEQAAACGLGVRSVVPSPILGPAGNREFLAWFQVGAVSQPIDVDQVVHRAWHKEGTAWETS